MEFLDAIKKAEAEGEAALLAQINTASKDTWQAAAWILERKYPERWGKKDALALSGGLDMAHTGEVKHDVSLEIKNNPQLRRAVARAVAILETARRGEVEPPGPGVPGRPSMDNGKTSMRD